MSLDIDMPKLEDYEISSKFGFLSDVSFCEVQLDPYYEPWVSIANSLPNLIMTKRIRRTVNDLPVLSCDRIRTTNQRRKAYSILAFICHAYVWGDELPAEIVPPSVSIPFKDLCAALELPTVATYAAVVLWNFWTTHDRDQPDRLDNLSTQLTFTGASDESWFYLVSVAIEARGGPLIQVGLNAVLSAQQNDVPGVTEQLNHLLAGIRDIAALTQRMSDNCDPHFFYRRIRVFLTGSSGTPQLPHGLYFDDGTRPLQPVQHVGGSNAQSSLIQFIDIALGVKHSPTNSNSASKDAHATHVGEVAPSASSEELAFVDAMRDYMPGPHRRFLYHFARIANIRSFVQRNSDHQRLVEAYNACITALVRFRDIHLQIANRYVVLQDPKNRRRAKWNATCDVCRVAALSTTERDVSLGAESTLNDASASALGTGGTTLVPFLKQIRDETCILYTPATA